MLHWDELETTLVRDGAAPRYAQRLRDELADHRAALVEDQRAEGAGSDEAERAADQALGDIETIVTMALAGRGTHSLARTRPSLVFLIGPLAMALVSMTVAIGVACGLAWVALNLFGVAEDNRLLQIFAHSSYTAIAFLILPGLGFLFCAQAWLSRAPMRWALAACLALAVLGGLCMLGYHLESPMAPGGTLYVGLGWEPRALRFALPLLSFLAFHLAVRYETSTAMVRSLRRFAV